MNEQIKNDWVNALRSGKYKKCRGLLRKSVNEFCTLGVLCDLYAKSNNKTWRRLKNTGFDGASYSILDSSRLLPEKIQDWAGIKRTLIDEYEGNYDMTLMDFNDTLDFTFEEMADLIESKWKDL